MNLRNVKIKTARLAVSTVSAFSFSKEVTGARVPVLCYHRVLPGLAETETPVYTLTPEEFAAQMAFLVRHDFQSLSFDEYAEIALGHAAPPERAVLLTFDDGYADNYHYAWKIAAHYGIKFNLFLCTGLVERNIAPTYGKLSAEAKSHRERYPQLWRPLTWLELKQMAESGVGLGFHSHTHQNYGRMTRTQVIEDIATGVSLLNLRLGLHPKMFAFPGGSAGTYNPAVISLIKRWGLDLLFTTRLGRTRLGDSGNLFSRLVIYQGDGLEVFRRKLFGAYDWLGRARSVDQALRSLWSKDSFQ